MVESEDPALEIASTFLTIPDLVNYWLTGEKVCEFPNATTTQCFDPLSNHWAYSLLSRLGIPTAIFPSVVSPGTCLGTYQGIPVIAPACHDTGSAVAAVPTSTPNYAYLSSGTWSLLGQEVPQAILTETALEANLTNEGGVNRSYRLLKNIMGLWLVQQSLATWSAQGKHFDYATLNALAREAQPFSSWIDPDDLVFLPPGDMPARIFDYCKSKGQATPDSISAIVRCILESLALKYRIVLDKLIETSQQPVDVIHIIGGGAQNNLLCQMTANATQRPVIAGPVEATALGNALLQWIALGEIGSLEEGRRLVKNSFELVVYQPQEREQWETALDRFKTVFGY
jgi:rhamnulokinase